MMNRLNYIFLLPLLFFACSGDGDLAKLQGQKTKLEKELADIEAQIQALDTSASEVVLAKVDVTPVKQALFEHYFEVQGTLEAENMAILTPENGGKVSAVNVKEGQTVAQGTILATFDQSVIASNIKELEKNIELAKYMYEKQQALFDQDVGTEVQLKQAKTQYEALLQTKKSLDNQAGKFVLKAPYSGYIEEVFIVEGEIAGPMAPIVRIVNTDKLKVSTDISEVYLKNLEVNSKATIFFPALSDTLNTQISRLGKFVNPVNRTIKAEIDIPSRPKYVPNLMAVVSVRDFADSSALILPSEAILEDSQGNAFVFVVKDSIATKKVVAVKESYMGKTMLSKGVSPKDLVVVRGARKLTTGQKIDIEKIL